MPKRIELLPCDWLISNVCNQAIEQVYLIKWPVSVCLKIRKLKVLPFYVFINENEVYWLGMFTHTRNVL